ncbi:protein TolR [Paracoccus sp. p4-l81]|uniref:protein TolR n=1 Tax=unclassified Paracoccus (in: a-proteobacteria) TaxID=2688777 RepID=UPI0035B8296C
MAASVVKPKERQSGRRRSRRGRMSPMAEINVTPFVDVMLVLLIIFMVAAPLLTVGVPLELPKTAAQAVPTEAEEPLAISLTADGQIALMTTPVAEDQLIDRLRAIAGERASDRIYLRADGAISYARVVQVMGALNAAGFANITLVTETGGPAMTGGM